jgi:hypothetical protein
MAWIWQHNKRTDDYKIILNCVRNLMRKKSEKEAGKAQTLKKMFWCIKLVRLFSSSTFNLVTFL